MYAFAIYDPTRRLVFLARDRLGIKPLYYAPLQRAAGNSILFASELRSLLASGQLAKRLSPAALHSYLWNGFVVGPNTTVEGISLLPPGTSMTVRLDDCSVDVKRYWSLGRRATRPEPEARECLESELLLATRQHLVSDVPLGIFLSGGVDSSAVAALAVRAGTSKVKTFHVGFEEAGFDESKYAQRVATGLGTEHTEYRLSQSKFVEQLDDAIGSLDQPTFDAINTYFVSRVVREAGFTVALAGTGGDELFGGYSSFRNLPKAAMVLSRLKGLPLKPVERALQLGMQLAFEREGRVSPQTRWAKLGALLSTGGDLVDAYQVLYALYTPDFLAALEATNGSADMPFGIPDEMRSELSKSIAGLSALEATSVLELGMFIGERLLRDSDAASMAVSLELRVPLLDHRVVEAAQRVPVPSRYQPLGRKALLRELSLSDLDPTIFDRPKAGFVLPIAVWAKDRLASDIEATFSDRHLVESVGLRSKPLLSLWHSFSAGARGMYWSRVWAPYVLLRWCRAHGVSLA
jgi:asparagine synthase (glutamine-hydrolysing)